MSLESREGAYVSLGIKVMNYLMFEVPDSMLLSICALVSSKSCFLDSDPCDLYEKSCDNIPLDLLYTEVSLGISFFFCTFKAERV